MVVEVEVYVLPGALHNISGRHKCFQNRLAYVFVTVVSPPGRVTILPGKVVVDP